MKYNKIERCKFSKSRRHLIELMRAYGLKNVLIREKGEDAATLVRARTYVIKDMERLNISLNVEETRQENWKPICDNLSPQEITVIFFRALAAVKEGYIEDFTPENNADQKTISLIKTSLEKDWNYLCTFEEADDTNLNPFPFTPNGEGPGTEKRRDEIENYRNLLIEMGLGSIITIPSLDKLFWRLAAMGIEMNQSLRDAIVSLTDNPEMRDQIDYMCDKYNETVTTSKTFRHRQYYLSLKKELEHCKDRIALLQADLAEKKKELKNKNVEITGMRKKYIREFHERISNNTKNRKVEKAIYKRLFSLLNSAENLAYNLNDEKQMMRFLEWFEIGKHHLNKGKINYIIRHRITDEEAKNKFQELAQQMNERIHVAQQSSETPMPIDDEDQG